MTDEIWNECPTIASRALHNTLIGREIGRGSTRVVYQTPMSSELVIKFETAKDFQNVQEFLIWDEVKGTEHEKWFAPVRFISSCSRILVQEKTEAIPPAMFPSELPSYFTDIKQANFGLLDGRIVCHDYGYFRGTFLGLTKRMKKVTWGVK